MSKEEIALRKWGYLHTHTLPQAVAPHEVICVNSGAYAVVDMERKNAVTPRLLTSGGFIECVGVLGCVKDAEGKPVRWAYAHLTVNNSAKKSIRNMVENLRGGDEKTRIEWDIFGGDEFRDGPMWKQSGDRLAQRVQKRIAEVPNSTVENKLFDAMFRESVTVDLRTGKKYAGHITQAVPHFSTELAQRFFCPAGGACAKYNDTLDRSNLHEGLVAAVKYDWETCLPEIEQVYKNNSARIEAKLKRDFDIT